MKSSIVDIQDLTGSGRAVLLVDTTKSLTKKKLTSLELVSDLITVKAVKDVDEAVEAVKTFITTGDGQGGVVVYGVDSSAFYAKLEPSTTAQLASKDVYLRAYAKSDDL
jgi:hypothetical protein